MIITEQTQEIVNAVRNVSSDKVKQENLHIEVRQNVDTDKEYIIIWCDE